MFNTLTWDLLCQMTTKYHSVYNVHWRKISICGLDKGNFASIIGATIHWVVGSIERSCDGNRIVFFFIFTVSFHYKKKISRHIILFLGKEIFVMTNSVPPFHFHIYWRGYVTGSSSILIGLYRIPQPRICIAVTDTKNYMYHNYM